MMIIQSITQVTSLSRPRYIIVFVILFDNILYYARAKKEILEAYSIQINLLLSHFLLALPLRIIFRIQPHISPKIFAVSPKGRYLIVANHQKAIDPYIMFAALPAHIYKRFIPIRFFTANIFLTSLWKRFLIRSCGGFRAYSYPGKISGVKGGLQLSDLGHSLVIFPEGKRMRRSEERDIKFGIGYLAQHREFTILPVYIDYQNKKTHVYWGKPFQLKDLPQTDDVTTLSHTIFDKVLTTSTLT